MKATGDPESMWRQANPCSCSVASDAAWLSFAIANATLLKVKQETLQAMKVKVSFSIVAASTGYVFHERESSCNSAVIRHANGDKIIVAESSHGHWVHFSVRDDADNGPCAARL